MMRKCYKGNTYLVRGGDYWYIIQQEGMKSWEALLFSHVAPEIKKYFHGNSTSLVEQFKSFFPNDLEFYVFRENKDLRVAMFNILKTGQMTEGVKAI